MDTRIEKNRHGSVRIDVRDRIVIATFADVINDSLAEHYLQSLRSVAESMQGQPWAYLSNARHHQAFTPKVIETIEKAFRVCTDNGCIVDAYIIGSPLSIKLVSESRAKAGIVSDLSERIFDNEEMAIQFLQKRLAVTA